MSIQERKERHKESVRAAIINTARNIAINEGWQAVSMRKIAEVIEYSAPVIYDYFENKDKLLFEISLEGFRALVQKLEQSLDFSLLPKDLLFQFSIVYWDFAFENQVLYEVMFSLKGITCSKSKIIPMEVEKLNSVMQSILEKLLFPKECSKEILHELEMNLICLLHGYISMSIVGKLHAEQQEIKKSFLLSVERFIKSIQ
ncbi:MAG: TetR/AcrR family transcriptional regulator [Bacteroidota bacterium]|nr:TetR/AcrR family transcriptional regulator [Bacteroidota bacterium]